MAIQYKNEMFLVRCRRTCKLYKYPTVFTAVSVDVDMEGILFESNKSAELTNGMKLLQITSSSAGIDSVLGYWVDESICDTTPISLTEEVDESVKSNDSVATNVCLHVTGSKIVIYETYESSTPLNCGLKLGDDIFCDRMINVTCNGIDETRYHIVGVSDDADDSVIDSWVLSNFSVTNDDGLKIVDIDMATPVNRRMVRNAVSYAMNSNARVVVEPDRTYVGGNVVKAEDNIQVPKSAASYDSHIEKAQLTNTTSQTTSTTASTTEEEQRINDAMNAAINNPQSLDSATLYQLYGYNYEYSGTNTTYMNIPIGRMLFVHGMPFQFTATTDRRNYSTRAYGVENESDLVQKDSTDMYGRVFAKEIVTNTPVAVFTPGTPRFLTSMKVGIFSTADADGKKKDSWVPAWISEDDSAFNDMIRSGQDNYDYFSMQIDTTDYFKYVNACCQTSARLMGLASEEYRGTKCTKFDWGKYNTSASQEFGVFEEVMGLDGGVSFAFDPQSSITDSISNTTGDSQLAGLLNQASAKVKEIEFLAGAGMATKVMTYSDDELNSAVPEFSTGIEGVGQRIGDLFKNTVSGMNIRFPEIWTDSSSSKSYSLDMRFVTPYANSFCEWRYVLVPYFHIFCLAAPRSQKLNAYQAPFLIRAFSKGYFNVELGIVETLTFKRFGDGDMIAENGVPTEIDVSVDFKDLYHSLSVSKFGDGLTGSVEVFFNNTGLMDLIGTMSGVNMNRISLSERISMYTAASTSVFGSLGSNWVRHFTDRTRQLYEKYIIGS